MWTDAVARCPEEDAIRYFDTPMTVAELDRASDALASGLHATGFSRGDRLALYVQNGPAFVIGMLGCWKAGGVLVPVNPMYKSRELAYVLTDSRARAILCLDETSDVVREVQSGGEVAVAEVIVTSGHDFQSRDDTRVLTHVHAADPGARRLVDVLGEHDGRSAPEVAPSGLEDVAVLVYTSGTTGEPKGARLTHANLLVNAQNYREWMGLSPGDGILAVAPLFHITGLVGHAVVSLMLPAPLVLGHRFHPAVMVDLIREHRPRFTVGAITALSAIAQVDGIGPSDFSSLTKLYTGGAAVAPAVADRLESIFGTYVHNAYGLTETASITHVVPHDRRAPVDPVSGALSIGVPVASVSARVVADDGAELPAGQVGEIAISGPQVADGYWGKPEASRSTFVDGELRTGDVGFMDEAGWFYLVDRKKDMINAAGYKVWPREVEDVLYGHPDVREAAVVGVPDEYRGETVHAFVSLRRGGSASGEDLITWCRNRMAAYKYPRRVFVVDELPKTTSGKILRRELRP
ncbi:long-chain fatty acid--CoA ligase [Janibacter melonis]|nr:long-chain fatty acid--CoA ligase [Janibacter melonis]